MNNFKLTRNNILANIIEFESDGGVREIIYDVSDKIADIIEDLQKKAELGEHYKHLYSELKRQKDEIFEYIKSFEYYIPEDNKNELLRMVGETE